MSRKLSDDDLCCYVAAGCNAAEIAAYTGVTVSAAASAMKRVERAAAKKPRTPRQEASAAARDAVAECQALFLRRPPAE